MSIKITKVKFWSKAVQGENVEHVKIGYKDLEGDQMIHKVGNTAVATEEFYNAFYNLPIYVCKICALDEELQNGIFCKDVSISPSEDKEGNDTTEYTLLCTLKAGHATAVLSVSIQHKFIPEGFDQAIQTLIREAEAYIEGKRGQIDAFNDAEEIQDAEGSDDDPQESLDLDEDEENV